MRLRNGQKTGLIWKMYDYHVWNCPGVYREDAFKEEYENALVLKKMLDEYRTY